MKWYPVFLTLQLHLYWGMKGGLEGQTRAQRQGDFTWMCSSTHINRDASLVLGSHSYFQKANSKSWLNCREVLIAIGDPLFANEGESIAEFQERYIQAVKQLFDRYVGLSPDPNHKLIITWASIWCYGSESFVHTVEGRGLWSPKTKWAKFALKIPATNWNKKLLCCAICHFGPLFEVADTLNSIEIYSFLLKNCACSHCKFLQFSSIFFSQHSMGMPSMLLLLMVALLQLSSCSLIKLCNSWMS